MKHTSIPQIANASLAKVQSEMQKALAAIFQSSSTVQVQKHHHQDETIMVFISDDVCVTMNVQQMKKEESV